MENFVLKLFKKNQKIQLRGVLEKTLVRCARGFLRKFRLAIKSRLWGGYGGKKLDKLTCDLS